MLDENLEDKTILAASQADNSTNSRVLQSHASDDSLRATTGEHVRNRTLTGGKLALATVLGENLADRTLGGAKLALTTVLGENLADRTLTGGKLALTTVLGENVAGRTLTGGKLALATVLDENLADRTLTGAKLALTTVLGENVAGRTLTGGKLALATVLGENLADRTLTGAKLALTTVFGENIADRTIFGGKIALGSVFGENLADRTIFGGKIAFETVFGENLADRTLTGVKIALGSVFGENLANRTLTGVKLALTTVLDENLADKTILAGSQADNSTDSRVLRSNASDDTLRAVITDSVRNKAITYPKLAGITGNASADDPARAVHGIENIKTRTINGVRMVLDTVGFNELSPEIDGPARGTYGFRAIGGNGTSVHAAGSDHVHSVSFKHLEKVERLRILDLRDRLEAHGKTAPVHSPLSDLLETVGDVLHMLCDDPDMESREREELLAKNDERARRYRRDNHMHHDGPTASLEHVAVYGGERVPVESDVDLERIKELHEEQGAR